jgi:ubiquinone/menaquinone biosynthesis C-methylase UbiE
MNEWSEYYRQRFQADPRRAVTWQIIAGYLQKEVPAGATVLELGAGYCDFINNIRAKRKLALDVAENVRDAASSDVGTCRKLDFTGEQSVDVVFASNLLEHLPIEHVWETLSEVRRVLKPGGKIILIQPNYRYAFRHYFDDYTHVTVFSDVSLTDALKVAGFKVLRVRPRFLPLTLKSRLPVIRALVRLYLWSPVKPLAGQMLVVAQK